MSNPELDIPFDETEFSPVAYDLGPGGHHASIDAGRFIPGRFGNCVYFLAEGKAEIIPQIYDLSKDFTFMIWVKAESPTAQTYVLLKFPGVNNFKAIYLHFPMQYWTHFCISQEGNIIRAYLNGDLKGTYTRATPISGFALLSDATHSTGGFCSLDGGKSYPTAVPPTEIKDIIENTLQPVNIFVNNINLKDLGVVVEDIEGVLDMPNKKDPLKVDWDDYHGEVIDLVKPVLDVRNFSLKCWIKATNKEDLIQKWVTFKSYFEQPGTQRIRLDAGTKPLIFEAYHPESLKIENKWRDGTHLYGRFTLKLREPLPVKRILKVNGPSCSITLTSQKMLTIFWGDGSSTHNIYGTDVTRSHSYSSAGEYYVVIAGNIEEVTDFSTDAAVVWNKI